MQPLILLDVDGILNPTVSRDPEGPHLTLTPDRVALVHELAGLGEVVWSSTWSAEVRRRPASDLGLPSTTRAIDFTSSLDRSAPTPKLSRVQRWLELRKLIEELDWTAVVWIDDGLRLDAVSWLAGLDVPALAVVPDAAVGLAQDHVDQARWFLAGR